MKNLKTKIFSIIFLMLTFFVIFIFLIYNTRSYFNEYNRVKSSIEKTEEMSTKNNRFNPDEQKPEDRMENIKNIRFMDSKIYTITLDDNNNIDEITYHYEQENEDNIKKISKDIINNADTEGLKIGNLYLNNYAYSYNKNNCLILMDISEERNNLLSNLYLSLGIIALLEILIIYVTKRITFWIIKPVQDSFDAQKQFVSDASHELKTPLAVIMASCEILEEKVQNKYLNNIKNESERMDNLIKRLLDLSRLENSDIEYYEKNNISKILELSSLTYETIMFEKNVTLKTEIEKDIEFKCDSEGIKQLNAILIDNAIKHSEENSEIKVYLAKSKNEIIYKVTNKGEEIKEEDRKKIFERFYRGDKSRNRNDNRYGLGLAIAKQIVINHNGNISVNCKDGYTTFNVSFKIS